MRLLKARILCFMLILVSFTTLFLLSKDWMNSLMALSGMIGSIIAIEYYTQQMFLLALRNEILKFMVDRLRDAEKDRNEKK